MDDDAKILCPKCGTELMPHCPDSTSSACNWYRCPAHDCHAFGDFNNNWVRPPAESVKPKRTET